jgi:NADPH:quinone reductase-like Zn-dependent oxidoreductase
MQDAAIRHRTDAQVAQSTTMFAVATGTFGPPSALQLVNMAVPRPLPGEVLVRIRASTVSAADSRIRGGRFPRGLGLFARLMIGWNGPRNPVLGWDFAGEVAAIGPSVTRFRPGDPVFGIAGAKGGCHTQFRCVPADGPISLKPDALDWAQAAAIPFGGCTALFYLRDKLGLKRGERILIIGASGAVGSAAVQLAKHFGAHVTTVTSGRNTALMREMGADEAIDRNWADWRELDLTWDVIFDTTGTVTARMAKPCLTNGGKIALVAADLPAMLSAMLSGMFAREPRIATGVAPERRADLEFLAEMAAKGGFAPLVSGVYRLADAAAAHELADSGRKVGNIVLLPNG